MIDGMPHWIAVTRGPAEVVCAHLDAFSAKNPSAMLATMDPAADFATGTTRVERSTRCAAG